MEALDYWKLCDRITIFQAIMLVIGLDPQSQQCRDVEGQYTSPPDGYGAVKTALVEAVKGKNLVGEINAEIDRDINGEKLGYIPDTVDIDRSYVSVASLKNYLKDRDFDTGFFFPLKLADADYLDPENNCYAPKLAAAVEAWTVVTGEKKHETESTPKQLMEKWLRENAHRFGLNKADGKLNEDGIGQITKIANWRPEGGASKTPSSKNPSAPVKNKVNSGSQGDNAPSLRVLSGNPRAGSSST